jgi:2-keto-4-pentenoate hydratase/2-oxohepta-3-ene-1,7-dioic acid hydratase in catechol pathway
VANVLALTLQDGTRARTEDIAVDQAVIAGWTGRDPVAVEKHIRELEALGVKRPATTPIFYRVSASRLTTADTIEAVGESSGGEVEFVLLQHGGRLWVGAGSDHTDREVETYGVTVSKQMCEKPIAPVFWPYDEVAAHWDRLILRAHVAADGTRVLYQEGAVSAMMYPMDLIARHAGKRSLPEGTIMFCGTLAARGGVRPTPDFAFELDDPVLGRKIAHAYRVRTLPVLG